MRLLATALALAAGAGWAEAGLPSAVSSRPPGPGGAASVGVSGGGPVPRAQVALDRRELYDVGSYHLDLEIDPEARRLDGAVTIEGVALAETPYVELDLVDELDVDRVVAGGEEVGFAHFEDRLLVQLAAPLAAGDRFALTVHYGGSPSAENDFSGFHWRRTPEGEPWIGTSCQGPGAHSWWPCKASYFHPEDEPDRVSMDATVPAGLVAVSNGRLAGVEEHEDGRRTFRWRHPYPIGTYGVTLNVAPYVALEGELELPGLDAPLPYAYYLLPGSVEKAEVQFAQVPELLAIFSEAFGPWPFPDAKFGLVETSFWGMEHSTAVAYGSSFPAWCVANGAEDRYARRNRWFDYILVHEVAHEWWGNAVSAEDWGDFWIHEGFATYAEGVYVEHTQGREAADRFFSEVYARVAPDARLHRGRGTTSGQAYAGAIYSKGAAVLHTFRHLLADDELWWEALRTFQLRHRHGNATTDDLRAVLDEVTGRSWEDDVAAWVYGAGHPRLTGRVYADGRWIRVALRNEGTAATTFRVPLDLAWTAAGEPRSRRVWLAPGANLVELDAETPVTDLRVLHLDRLLGTHDLATD